MKLLMFAPINLSVPVAALVRQLVVQLLALGHEVAIVNTKLMSLSSQSDMVACEQVHWINKSRIRGLMNSSDVIIYHLGNSAWLYQACIFWLTRRPGIVWLHDSQLDHLFKWRRRHEKSEKSSFIQWICRFADGIIAPVDFDMTSIPKVLGSTITNINFTLDKIETDRYLKKNIDHNFLKVYEGNYAQEFVSFCYYAACGLPILNSQRYFHDMLLRDWKGNLEAISVSDLTEPLRLLEKTSFPEGEHHFKSWMKRFLVI